MSDLIATINGLEVTRSSIWSSFSIFSAEDDTWYAEISFSTANVSGILMRNFAFQQSAATAREFAAALTLAAEIADAGPTWKPDPAPAALTATEDAIERDIDRAAANLRYYASVANADNQRLMTQAADMITRLKPCASALIICHASLDSATFLLDKREAAINAALTAANEGRWTTVKTLLQAAHHDGL